MDTALAEKAFEALQVLWSTRTTVLCQALYALVSVLYIPSNLGTSCAQAEQQSTEFRIKALGKALEYKHLEVLFSFL